jgi:hypothetical protein
VDGEKKVPLNRLDELPVRSIERDPYRDDGGES